VARRIVQGSQAQIDALLQHTQGGGLINTACFCQPKTDPFDHRKQIHFGQSACTLTIENGST